MKNPEETFDNQIISEMVKFLTPNRFFINRGDISGLTWLENDEIAMVLYRLLIVRCYNSPLWEIEEELLRCRWWSINLLKSMFDYAHYDPNFDQSDSIRFEASRLFFLISLIFNEKNLDDVLQAIFSYKDSKLFWNFIGRLQDRMSQHIRDRDVNDAFIRRNQYLIAQTVVSLKKNKAA